MNRPSPISKEGVPAIRPGFPQESQTMTEIAMPQIDAPASKGEMRERAELLGGELLAAPTPNGFRIELRLPPTE